MPNKWTKFPEHFFRKHCTGHAVVNIKPYMTSAWHKIAISLLLFVWGGLVWGAPIKTGNPSNSPASASAVPAITDVAVEKSGLAIVVKYSDGSRSRIRAAAQQSFVSIIDQSQDHRWVIVEWTDPSALGGSLGGRIETINALVSIDQRKIVDPVALGLGNLVAFSIEQQGKTGVLRYSVVGEKADRTIELNALEVMVEKNSHRHR